MIASAEKNSVPAALTIYFVRHAEAHNPSAILYGRMPGVDLSETGRKQASELAEALSSLRVDAIYHSPLLRARRTARMIAERHAGSPLKASTLLLENRHPYQGRPQADVGKLSDPYAPDVLGADGESIADLRDRHLRFLGRVKRELGSGVAIAVGHADPLAALRAHLLGKPLSVATLRVEAPPLASAFQVVIRIDGSQSIEWFWRPAAAKAGASASGGKVKRAAHAIRSAIGKRT